MRHFNVIAAMAATLLVGGVASAKDKSEGPKEKKICVTSEDSSSRLGFKRICRTKSEWDGTSPSASRQAAEPSDEPADARRN